MNEQLRSTPSRGGLEVERWSDKSPGEASAKKKKNDAVCYVVKYAKLYKP